MRPFAVLLATAVIAVGMCAVPAVADATDLPAPPTSLTVVSDTGPGYTLSWQPSPSTDVTGYQVQVSDDGAATWNGLVGGPTTATQYPVAAPPAGHVVSYRVVADNAAGESAPTNDVTMLSPGTTTQTLAVRMPDGRPVTGGQLSWSDGYGTWHDGYSLDVHGRVNLTSVPAGVGMLLRVSDATIAVNEAVDKEYSLNFGTQPQTIVVPEPPAMEVHKVTVQMPGAIPAVGVEVDASYYQALENVVQTDGYTYSDFNTRNYANTGADGSATVRGWSAAGVQFIPPPRYPYPQQAINLIYNDGVLGSETVAFLTGDTTVVQIAPLPFTTTSNPAPVPIGDTASVRFRVHAAPTAASAKSLSAVASLAGVHVILKPPAGWSASSCSKKSSLSGVTDAYGYVTLPLCAPRMSRFTVRTVGALPTAPVTVYARHSAPGAPYPVSATSPAREYLRVVWGKAAYTGGATVSRYRIVATSPHHPTVSWSAPANYTSHTFTRLARGAVWTVTVRAVNVYGTGPARSASVRVR